MNGPGPEPYDRPHVPAEPDPGIGAVLERVRRAIAGEHDGREAISPNRRPGLVDDDTRPCPSTGETS